MADAGDDEDVAERTQTVLSNGLDLKVNLLVNYRKYKGERVLRLINLARREKRLSLTISLPLNQDDQPQRDFELFVIKHLTDVDFEKKSMLFVADFKGGGRLEINDLRQSDNSVAGLGRLAAGQSKVNLQSGVEEQDFAVRGLSSIHINPEGLWLQTLVTRFESHTSFIWTPLNETTIGILSRIPLANRVLANSWPGGLGLAHNGIRIDVESAFRVAKPFEPRIVE